MCICIGFIVADLDCYSDVALDMDSDNYNASAATPPLPGKVRRCLCGRRISSLTYDFHTLCTVCRGRDCDTITDVMSVLTLVMTLW